jgi:hypothetical protein
LLFIAGATASPLTTGIRIAPEEHVLPHDMKEAAPDARWQSRWS